MSEKIRVLVVDDNVHIITLMRELLTSRGYEVIAVSDAAQAEAVSAARPTQKQSNHRRSSSELQREAITCSHVRVKSVGPSSLRPFAVHLS